jgi:hypothetical protein
MGLTVLDGQLHAIERAQQEDIVREREWSGHGNILVLNGSSVHLRANLKVSA